MDILVHIPDDLARRLGTADEVAPELQRLLGFDAGATLDAFFKSHGVPMQAGR